MRTSTDAALQLTLTDTRQPELGADEFFRDPSVNEVDRARRRIHGRAAVVSSFVAQSSNGSVEGVVAHIEHGQRVYWLLVYAPEAAVRERAALFQDVVTSSASVTDRKILPVEPEGIEIVRLDRETTLTEFSRTYPSDVSLEELAVVNQVSDVDEEIAATTQLKRIQG